MRVLERERDEGDIDAGRCDPVNLLAAYGGDGWVEHPGGHAEHVVADRTEKRDREGKRDRQGVVAREGVSAALQ
jgi:hypothetical protein